MDRFLLKLEVTLMCSQRIHLNRNLKFRVAVAVHTVFSGEPILDSVEHWVENQKTIWETDRLVSRSSISRLQRRPRKMDV
jgi:hypothetical protein